MLKPLGLCLGFLVQQRCGGGCEVVPRGAVTDARLLYLKHAVDEMVAPRVMCSYNTSKARIAMCDKASVAIGGRAASKVYRAGKQGRSKSSSCGP